jgi:ribosomal protein S18 acetylase RimI-like enzyme
MIRLAVPDDTPTLVELAAATGVFKPFEIDTLGEVLDDYHGGNHEQGDRCFVLEENGVVLGFSYHAPEAMTDRTWCLWWIAVRPATQGKGIGTQLLRFVEEDIRQQNGRLLEIETSSTPHYEPTRQFYLKQHYTIVATKPDYYADGDSMVIFSKRL